MNLSWWIVVSGIGATAAAFAAGFWLWASLIPVPDNIDTFIGELQRISRINAYGAMSACVAAISGVVLFVIQMIQE